MAGSNLSTLWKDMGTALDNGQQQTNLLTNLLVCTGMLREGEYGTYYQKACKEAGKEKSTSLKPLEFTHVMIDEAGQVSVVSLCAMLCWTCTFKTLCRLHVVVLEMVPVTFEAL